MVWDVGIDGWASVVRGEIKVEVTIILQLAPTKLDHLIISKRRDFFLNQTFKLNTPNIGHAFNHDDLAQVNSNFEGSFEVSIRHFGEPYVSIFVLFANPILSLRVWVNKVNKPFRLLHYQSIVSGIVVGR